AALRLQLRRIVGRGGIGGVQSVGALDVRLAEPVDRGGLLAVADGNDRLDPGRIEKGVAQVVAVELQEPAERAAEPRRGAVLGYVVAVAAELVGAAPTDDVVGGDR